jgi:hypothetical protein
MAHFQLPLDLPHAGRLADRILMLIDRHAEETGNEAADVRRVAGRLTRLLGEFVGDDDNPPEPQASRVRAEAAGLVRELVTGIEAGGVGSDRLGQFVRNLFECLELGEEGMQLSLRAGENPDSLQRPV